MAAHQVRALLMGGQACVFYGAAEFSRDTDLLLLLNAVMAGDFAAVVHGLANEEHREREADRIYWQPLKQELERLRRAGVPGRAPPV